MLTDSFSKQGTNYIESQDPQKNLAMVRRKPGRPPKQHPPGTINGIVAECAVCHDKATGLHYAVMTCEGCKGFFKRSIQAEKQYKCRAAGDCVINKDSRNACQACRMKSCFKVGMKEKLVRDDRTPGNRKKRLSDSNPMANLLSSDNSDNATEPCKNIKQEGIIIDPVHNLSSSRYPILKRDDQDSFITNYDKNMQHFNYFHNNDFNNDILYNSISTNNDFDDWSFSLMGSDATADINTTDVIQQITTACDQTMGNRNNSMQISINCSGDQETPMAKCRQNPKCLMHLLTRLMKAKPAEPAFCKYFGRFPTSEQFLDCLADEIHLIIKFAKKTPGFCDLSMNRKLNVVQKHVLSILFFRIMYRSLSCPPNHIQFASNLCLNVQDFEKIEILSSRFRQAFIELISSFKSFNLDMYELCLIQYTIIEEKDWEPDIRYCPMLDGFEKATENNSQTYLKLYTTNKYPDQPHRWIFIMLSLTQIQEMVTLFTTQCIEMVNAQRIIISNDILKEILSI